MQGQIDGRCIDEAKPERGFTVLTSSVRLSKALGVHGNKWNKSDCRRVFDIMDADGSGEVDQRELEGWVLRHNIFEEATENDSKKKLTRMFTDMDKSGDGSLDFEEFYRFCRLLEREQRNLSWASKHYLTALPKSQAEMNKAKFTLDYIERELHWKIEQFTSKDTDRFRQVLGMFRTQVQKAENGRDEEVLGVSKRDFGKMLSWLGLFATEDQAETLFNKYDVNGDGLLTVHEFLTRARPSDFPGSRRAPARMFSENKGGKKIYGKHGGMARGGPSVRVKTPHPDCFVYSTKEFAHTIRTKLANSGKVGQVYPDARGRRDLLKIFRYFDKEDTGVVTFSQFKRALKMGGFNSVGKSHFEVIFSRFGKDYNKTPVLDYLSLVDYVFPNWQESPDAYLDGTTLDLRNRSYIRMPDGTMGFVDKKPVSRGMRKSGSVAELSAGGTRKLSSARSMSRSVSAAQLSRPFSTSQLSRPSSTRPDPSQLSRPSSTRPDPNLRAYYQFAPGNNTFNKAPTIEAIAPSKQVNPLQAVMPADFDHVRAKNKKAIIL
jgi:Ca2+-binding EF-hand superfamily protein